MALKLEWDTKKADLNENKHGITFEDAGTVMSDSLSITIPDPLHPGDEARLVKIGQSDKQKTLIVKEVRRELWLIKMISIC